VEVNGRDTHFITRRGGEASVTTADGRSLSIYPSEDIVVTAGNPVKVALTPQRRPTPGIAGTTRAATASAKRSVRVICR